VSGVVVIGATGHVGTYLVPRLVRGGHEALALSRGEREPYRSAPEWRSVQRVAVDREAEDAAGTFGDRIAELRPDVVVDMLCFSTASAQAFERALTRSAAIGSSFHVVSEQAMTMRGLAAGVAGWFGREPLLDLVDWSEFERRVGAEHAGVTRDHAGRSIAASIDRARDLLGYTPRYSSLDALHESLRWLAANGHVDVGGQDF
jgi:nucleoside-diphosphate-sugar epimerase